MILIFVDYTIALSGGLIFRNLVSRVNIEHRGKMMGFSSFFMNLGATVGPIIGGIVWDAFGAKSPFIVSIFVELSLIPLYWLISYYLLPHLAETYNRNEKNKKLKK
jgi:MFS family permease